MNNNVTNGRCCCCCYCCWEYIFLKWILNDSNSFVVMESNTELAILSNVCQQWRTILVQVIVATTTTTTTSMEDTSSSSSFQQQQQQQQRTTVVPPTEVQQKTTTIVRPLLLLPSMVRQIKNDYILQKNRRTSHPNNSRMTKEQLYTNYNVTTTTTTQSQPNTARMLPKDTFFVAWFPSEGIQEVVVDLPPSNNATTTTFDNNNNNNSNTIDELSQSLFTSTINTTFHPDDPSSTPLNVSSSCDTNFLQQKPIHKYHLNSVPTIPQSDISNNYQNQQLQQQQQQQQQSLNGKSSITTQAIQQPQPQRQQQTSPSVHGTERIIGLNPTTKVVPTMNQRGVITVCTEWRGYRSPYEVLSPFGYTKLFINDVIETTIRSTNTIRQSSSCNGYEDLVEDNDTTESAAAYNNNYYYHPTYAVRGATVARPEHYCLCYDTTTTTTITTTTNSITNGRNNNRTALMLDSDSDYDSSDDDDNNTTTTNNCSNDVNYNADKVAIRNEQRKESMQRYEQHKKLLQQNIIPISLLRNNGSSSSNNYRSNQQQPPQPQPPPMQQKKCVQFLNSTGSNAVCMKTPLFDCGPINEPITILCIGIATEDGCFLSGLYHRFEFGHLYPNNDLATATDRSPICVATELRQQTTDNDTNTTTTNSNHHLANSNSQSLHSTKNDDDACKNGLYRINSESKIVPTSRSNSTCDCLFQDIISKSNYSDDDYDNDDNNNNDDDDENLPRFVHRGVLGPGAWHCYTAMVDGSNTQIRIDGIVEPISHQKQELECDNKNEGCNDNNNNSNNNNKVEYNQPILDGLTIGSDHCFGMSLCCGDGSDGEGEGAIAELVVFAGRLCNDDLSTLENYLMKKHGIISPVVPTADASRSPASSSLLSTSIWIENELERRAHAIFTSDSFGSVTMDRSNTTTTTTTIPLRYLARHRSVAWKQTNPVTGQPIIKTKIGQRRTMGNASSSDW